MQPNHSLFADYWRGETLLSEGRLHDAAETCKRLLDANPQFAYGYHLMSALFRSTGNFEKALNFSSLAISLEPSIPIFHLRQGELLTAMGELHAATQAYACARVLQPDAPEPIVHMAEALSRQQRHAEAAQLITEARQVGEQAQIDEVEGMCLWRRGEFAAALESFERLIEAAPDVPYGYVRKGQWLISQHRAPEAEFCFVKALKVRPGYVDATLGLAVVYALANEWQLAFSYAAEAVQFAPSNHDALTLMIGILLRLGKYSEAAHISGLLLSLAPQHAYAQESFAIAEARKEACISIPRFDAVAATPLVWLEEETTGSARIAQLLEEQYGPSASWRMLDLGCGIGTAAGLLRAWHTSAIGVDHSAGMVERARMSGHYYQVLHEDIASIDGVERDFFDFVAAIDVAPYVESVDMLFSAARRVLSPQGVFAFTHRYRDGHEPMIDFFGRRLHDGSMIEKIASDQGMRLVKRATYLGRDAGGGLQRAMAYLFTKYTTH